MRLIGKSFPLERNSNGMHSIIENLEAPKKPIGKYFILRLLENNIQYKTIQTIRNERGGYATNAFIIILTRYLNLHNSGKAMK